MANYRMVLDQRWENEAGSLRSRASSVISTGTKFSFSTLAHEEHHPNIDGVLNRLNSVASRNRPGSVFSCEEPAPPYEDQEATEPTQASTVECEAVTLTRSSTPVAEENVLQPTTPPFFDSESAMRDHYTRIIRTLDSSHAQALSTLTESHTQELSALRLSLSTAAQAHIEQLQLKYEQQLAATRNEIDLAYRKEFKAVRRDTERIREEAATEVANLKEENEKVVVKARNAVEDVWEGRWNDRIRVAADEVDRIEKRGQERIGRAAGRIQDLAGRHPELKDELEAAIDDLLNS